MKHHTVGIWWTKSTMPNFLPPPQLSSCSPKVLFRKLLKDDFFNFFILINHLLLIITEIFPHLLSEDTLEVFYFVFYGVVSCLLLIESACHFIVYDNSGTKKKNWFLFRIFKIVCRLFFYRFILFSFQFITFSSLFFPATPKKRRSWIFELSFRTFFSPVIADVLGYSPA